MPIQDDYCRMRARGVFSTARLRAFSAEWTRVYPPAAFTNWSQLGTQPVFEALLACAEAMVESRGAGVVHVSAAEFNLCA